MDHLEPEQCNGCGQYFHPDDVDDRCFCVGCSDSTDESSD